MSKQRENEQQLIKSFMQFLRSRKNYPEPVLQPYFAVTTPNGRVEMDLVLPDPNRSGFTAVFEFKSDLGRLKSEETRHKLLAYVRALGKVRRGAYLVGPGNSDSQQFTILQVFDEKRFEEIPEENFPTYDALLMAPTAHWPESTDSSATVEGDVKNVGGSKKTGNPSMRIESISAASVSDQPTAKDSLGFAPYVNAIARFLLNTDTRPPLTLSVEGEWGCGKSSFMKQLRQRLEAGNSGAGGEQDDSVQVRAVWFNAWRHDKSDALWAAFAIEFIEQVSGKMSVWERWNAGWRLTKARFDWKAGWWDVARWIFISLAWITFAVSGIYLWCLGAISVDKLLGGKELFAWGNELLTWGLGSGGVFAFFAATFFVFRQVSAILGNPLKHELKKHLKAIDYADRVAFIEKFHHDFARIVRAYVGGSKVFVFIDDLDRCEVPTAAELMQALNLMIAEENPIIFIVGMDREKVAAGLAAKHEKLLPYLSRSVNEAPERKNSHAIEYGFSFIEKFIQLPFRVPAPGPENLGQFLSDLRGLPATDSTARPQTKTKQSAQAANPQLDREMGINTGASETPAVVTEQKRRWSTFELRVAQDSDTIQEIVRMVAPALDYNPRKLKQFINAFRLKSYICFDTGLFNPLLTAESSPLTFERLAKFIAISLRWPLFLNDLHDDPKLLRQLTGESPADSSVAAHWQKRQRLMDLIRFKSTEAPNALPVDGDWEPYSLANFEVEPLMRVLPSVARAKKTQAQEAPTLQATHKFFDKAGIREVVTRTGSLRTEERITGELTIFQSKDQRTWLVCTNTRLFVLLDDQGTRRTGRIIQTSFDRRKTLPVSCREADGEGGVKFAAEETWWYYSLNLFPTVAALSAAVEELVGPPPARKGSSLAK